MFWICLPYSIYMHSRCARCVHLLFKSYNKLVNIPGFEEISFKTCRLVGEDSPESEQG